MQKASNENSTVPNRSNSHKKRGDFPFAKFPARFSDEFPDTRADFSSEKKI